MQVGTATLFAALFVASFSVIANFVGSYRLDRSWLGVGRLATSLVGVLVVGAVGVLLFYFVTDDFSVAYVVRNSQSAQPLVYKVSGLWGGQEGSLLLWAGFLAVFASVVAWTRQRPGLSGYASGIIMLTEVFFLLVLLLAADPFESSVSFFRNVSSTPVDGLGLNPLLLNPGMLFHPPTLYAGYAGFVIPFAFAMAGLLSRDDDWVRFTRKWTVFAWVFLGIGILVGGWWAYVILGWGGYWAWDPVENASLMPWLTGTAFLHSVMIQEKRGGLRVWNQVLILLTYVLTIYGVFLTRSGVVESVHSFAESGIGVYFLAFIGVSLVFSLGLLAYRWGYIKDESGLAESYLSKEVSFLLNNLVLLGLFFAVWWGTSFPFLSELLIGSKVSIGSTFYNQVTPPIAVALVVLMGVCPLLPWRRASPEVLKERFTYPVAAGLVAGVGAALQGPIAGIVVGVVVFVLATHLLDSFGAYSVLRRNLDLDPLRTFFRLVSRNRRRYGGYLVHVGVLFLVVGIAWSSVYSVERDVSFREGEMVNIPGGYTAEFAEVERLSFPDHSEFVGVLDIYSDGEEVYTARPGIGRYERQDMDTRNPDIWSSLFRDVYFIFNGMSGGIASFTVKVNPLVSFIWFGGVVMFGGGVVALWPEFSSRREELEEHATVTDLVTGNVYAESVRLVGQVMEVENDESIVVTDGDSELTVEGGGPMEKGDSVLVKGSYRDGVFVVEDTCPKCGEEVSPKDKFCSSCGDEL